jgi:hypothetical protein
LVAMNDSKSSVSSIPHQRRLPNSGG